MDKLSKYLLPTFYIGIIGVMIMCVLLVISGVKSFLVEKPNYSFSVEDVFTSDILPVIKSESNQIIKPYISDSVKVGTSFYDYKAGFKDQESSLIYYKGSYIQNNGVDYVGDDEFDVVSVLDGEVIGIEDNEVYGKILTIKHNDNLITKYCNVDNILVNVGYKVSQGEIIASSNKSIISNLESLHFEIIYKNEYINPESVYTMNVNELN